MRASAVSETTRAYNDRAGVAYRVLFWRGRGNPRQLGYDQPSDALAAAVDYLKAGYQVRLGDETVEHFRAEKVTAAPWFPSLRDWRLLDGMLRRAIESPGFFHVRAEQAGRAEAERLAGRIADVIDRIARHM
jgi:hypothetical protein